MQKRMHNFHFNRLEDTKHRFCRFQQEKGDKERGSKRATLPLGAKNSCRAIPFLQPREACASLFMLFIGHFGPAQISLGKQPRRLGSGGEAGVAGKPLSSRHVLWKAGKIMERLARLVQCSPGYWSDGDKQSASWYNDGEADQTFCFNLSLVEVTFMQRYLSRH